MNTSTWINRLNVTLTCYKFGVNVYLQSTCKILIYFTLHCHLELLKALETCMKNPTPKLYMLKMVYDIKSWISDYCEELHNTHGSKVLQIYIEWGRESSYALQKLEPWAMERAPCNAEG